VNSEDHILYSAQSLFAEYKGKAFSQAMGRVERYWAEENEEQKNVWLRIANTIDKIMASGAYSG
jgi:hypothetical protein